MAALVGLGLEAEPAPVEEELDPSPLVVDAAVVVAAVVALVLESVALLNVVLRLIGMPVPLLMPDAPDAATPVPTAPPVTVFAGMVVVAAVVLEGADEFEPEDPPRMAPPVEPEDAAVLAAEEVAEAVAEPDDEDEPPVMAKRPV